jgi:hypothetical protein
MSQYVFGAGVIWATPLQDAYGNAIATPTPIQLAVSQEISLDVSFDTKMLYGQNQFPVAVGRGKGKVSGKAKFAQVNGASLNSLFFGQTLSNGIVSNVYDTTGTAIPTTPYQITPTVPSSGTWSADLGVRNASGRPMTRVASAPATGQYSVAAGVYTFAAADTGLTVFISYQYTAASTVATKSTVLNVPMGYAPVFQADIYVPYQGKSLQITMFNAIASKLSFQTKLDDFMVPEIDFDGFANAAGNVIEYSLSE